MPARTIEALTRDMETSMSKPRAQGKEMAGLKNRMGAKSLAYKTRLRTILRDIPTSEQAKAVQDKKARFRDRELVMNQRLVALLKYYDPTRVGFEDQADNLEALAEELYQYRLVDTSIYPRILFVTDNHV